MRQKYQNEKEKHEKVKEELSRVKKENLKYAHANKKNQVSMIISPCAKAFSQMKQK